MAIRIDAADLAETVQGFLDAYGEVAENCMAEAAWNTAGRVVKELKKGGDFGGTGKYNKSWTRKMERKRLYASVKVYNKNHYRLTHLLEFGHAKVNGGRAPAFPHIAPVNDRVEDMFVTEFLNAVNKYSD